MITNYYFIFQKIWSFLKIDISQIPDDSFVIGGESIYKILLKYCDIVFVTKIHEVSTPMRCIAPIKVVSKTERSSEKYLQELPVKGFVLEAVPLSSFEHKANEPYADRANKGLFTKPPIHWQMMPKEYFGLRFAFKARA